jgi:hypothetical protein
VGGTGAFGTQAVVAVGGQPAFVVTADVDGDGDLDLLTANQFDNTVSVRLNNGQGAFSGGSTVAVGSAPTSIEAADVDGDGDLDLLCSNRSSVRLNNGTGTFSGGSDVLVGTLPAAVTTADIDGDGDLDLLAATNNVPAVVSVRLNNGSGTFSGSTDITASFLLDAIATADIDNDGDVDILAPVQGIGAGNVSSVVVLLNNGSGGFTRGTDVSVGPDPRALALGDIDNDGDADLLTANYAVGTVSVRLNNGAGIFGGSTELTIGSGGVIGGRGLDTLRHRTELTIGSGGSSVALADLDGDGDLDVLAAASASTIGVSVFQNAGTGVFSLASTYVVGAPYHITAADLDNDGDLDFVTSNYFSSSAEVRLNNGTGSPLAVQVPQLATRMTLWPNPTRNRVQLSDVGANKEVLLLDAMGRVMIRQAADGAGNAVIELPASLPAGTYIVNSLGRSCLLTVE